MNESPRSAFEGVRARYFALVWLALMFYLPGFEYLFTRFSPNQSWYWWQTAASYYTYIFFSLGLLLTVAGALPMPWKACFGRAPTRAEVVGGLKLTVFLIVASVALAYALFYPLSFLLPDFVTWWYLEAPPVVHFDGDEFPLLPNLLMFLFVCGVAPVFEELVFRAVLLPRLALKWGVMRGLLAMSAMFAVGHIDPIGAFLFAACMGVLYLRTQSLWLPILCHVVNNLVAWLIEFGFLVLSPENYFYTLEQFHDSWYWGVGCGLVALIWAAWYFKRSRRDVTWRFPVA
jgi:uncharacterized protein